MKTYTTVQGDMWDLIAYQQLGNQYAINQLLVLNKNYATTMVFDAGVVLNLPDVVTPKPMAGLPPWRAATQG